MLSILFVPPSFSGLIWSTVKLSSVPQWTHLLPSILNLVLSSLPVNDPGAPRRELLALIFIILTFSGFFSLHRREDASDFFVLALYHRRCNSLYLTRFIFCHLCTLSLAASACLLMEHDVQ